MSPEDARRLFVPTRVVPLDVSSVLFELEDGFGTRKSVTVFVEWMAGQGHVVNRFDPPLLVPGAVWFDTRALAAIALDVHRAMGHQFRGQLPATHGDPLHGGEPAPAGDATTLLGMDSTVVDQALRTSLWPVLKEAGFTRRTGRTAWRDHGSAVECVNVRSLGGYLAEGLGATPFSFGVDLGVFFPAIATRSLAGGLVNDHTRPTVCHFEKVLEKGLTQPNELTSKRLGVGRSRPALGTWVDRPDVWLVLADGSNVDVAVRDATEQVVNVGLPWLDAVADPREAIRRLMEEPDIFAGEAGPREMYGGALHSPGRWQAIGSLAAAGGDWDLLDRAVTAMSGLDYYRDRPAELDRLREELRAHVPAVQ